MFSIMAAEAAVGINVANMIGIGLPGCFHLRENIY